MNEQRKTNPSGPTFLAIGAVFVAVGIVLLVTNMSAAWIALFVIGVVFMSMSAMPFARKPKGGAEQTPPPQS